MSDIFISYAREDEQRVRSLAAALEERGWTVFWDRTVPAGQTWRDYIGRALATARCMIVVWSQHSIASQWVVEEADEGLRAGILVPVLLDAVVQPLGFRQIQAADLSEWQPGQLSFTFDKLIDDIRVRLDGNASTTDTPLSSHPITTLAPESHVIPPSPPYRIYALVCVILLVIALIFKFKPTDQHVPDPNNNIQVIPSNAKWGYAALTTPVKVRLLDIDDRGTLIVNSKTAQVTSYPNDSGWQDITDYFTNGKNEMVFEIFNGPYGGWGGRIQIQAGDHVYNQKFERNACPCNGTAFRIKLTLKVSDNGNIESLVAGSPEYM